MEIIEGSEERMRFWDKTTEIARIIESAYETGASFDFDMHENVAYVRLYEYYSKYYAGKRVSVRQGRNYDLDLNIESRRIGSFIVAETEEGGLVFDRIHGVDDIVRYVSEMMGVSK